MVIDTCGYIENNLYWLGHPGLPIFLLDRPEPAIFDAGVSCLGKLYVEAIKSVLGDRQPSILFLTHSHWDHCGSVSTLKNAFPEIKIAASARVADVVKRPNALSLIRSLNEAIAIEAAKEPELEPYLINEPVNPFEVDIKLQDGQIFNLGAGTTVQVLATPGHSQEHHSFYLPQEKILIAGEAAGMYYSPTTVSTEFVSDYDSYLASIQRLAQLPAEVFCQSHLACLVGQEEISDYFNRSINETIRFRNRVDELLDEEAGSVKRVVQRIKEEEYDTNKDINQPEAAYMLNLQARVAHLASKRSQQ